MLGLLFWRLVIAVALFPTRGLAFVASSSSSSVTLSSPPYSSRSSSSSRTQTTALATNTISNDENENEGVILPTTVGVTGATGKTGRLVVEELLNRKIPVIAMVRSMEKARETFGDMKDDDDDKKDLLTIVSCDLTSPTEIASSVERCDAVIWCATGFSDVAPPPSSTNNKKISKTAIVMKTFKRILGMAGSPSNEQEVEEQPKQSIDKVGIPIIADCLLKSTTTSTDSNQYPRVVMLSSAGVTRPSWDDAKKEKFAGAADIPIVRLNPFGILDIKAESEEQLRRTGVEYCIVRPCGLNDDWPSGSRPLVSQGDVAVGRINRKDVAKMLVNVLTTPQATGKTFEMVGLAGYPPPSSSTGIGKLLETLKTDKELTATSSSSSMESLESTYNLMQQLLPGETQDSAALAMGQTYEQLDKGETGRFGKRGQESLEAQPLRPTTTTTTPKEDVVYGR